MKNKLLKGAHLSERKYREILQLFCDDLTATQIADISGVSRVTINNYFRLIRSAIAAYCDDHYKHLSSGNNANGTVEEEIEFSTEQPQGYYGLRIQNGKIGTGWLKEIDEELINRLRSISKNGSSVNLTKNYQDYHAIADCSEWQLYWINAGVDSANVTQTLSEINGFWSHTKGRLHKFRGMNKKMLYLHIKECEFRYNFRNDDILLQLINVINNAKSAQHPQPEALRFA
ncbi:MAG: hypothetical protein QM802_00650 [Agriterribacter sp.]